MKLFILYFDNFDICLAHFIDKDDSIIDNIVNHFKDKPLYIFFNNCICVANTIITNTFENTQLNLLVLDKCTLLTLDHNFKIIKKIEGKIKQQYQNDFILTLNWCEVKKKLYNIDLI